MRYDDMKFASLAARCFHGMAFVNSCFVAKSALDCCLVNLLLARHHAILIESRIIIFLTLAQLADNAATSQC